MALGDGLEVTATAGQLAVRTRVGLAYLFLGVAAAFVGAAVLGLVTPEGSVARGVLVTALFAGSVIGGVVGFRVPRAAAPGWRIGIAAVGCVLVVVGLAAFLFVGGLAILGLVLLVAAWLLPPARP